MAEPTAPTSGGRQKGRVYSRDACWQHVKRTPTGKRHDQISCIYCNAIWYSSDGQRVRKHLQKCTSAPAKVKEQFQEQQPQPQVNLNGAQIPVQLFQAIPGGVHQPAGPVAYQTSTFDAIDRPSNATQTELQNACARWIYKSGLPLTTTEHPAFKTLMHNLNPGFMAPTRRQLAENHALERAIDSASQGVLANTLREICDRSDAGRQIATSMLLPPHPPPATGSTATRRTAESLDAIDRVCQHCSREFSARTQLDRDCMYHPGKSPNPIIKNKIHTTVSA